jgi:hypothetical protein
VNPLRSIASLSGNRLNYLNIGLMLVAAAGAFVRPFEVFLFAYAILGPLHYLTEISWLHDRKYFTRGRNDYLVLVAFAVLITLADLQLVHGIPESLRIILTYLAFGCALVFVLFGQWRARAWCFLALIATSGLVLKWDSFHSVFSVLMPTIIHVLVFTGLFILAGALKGRSMSGIGSLVVFCGCVASFYFVGLADAAAHVSEPVRKTYLVFAQLNYSLMTPFSRHDLNVPLNAQAYAQFVNDLLYQSPVALATMRLITFAYTYHYLNWFSKTSVIQWHNISRARFAGIAVLWLGSIAAYLHDYRLGLRWLFFLSFTHVFLEFPLNHLTVLNLQKELVSIVRQKLGQRPTAK